MGRIALVGMVVLAAPAWAVGERIVVPTARKVAIAVRCWVGARFGRPAQERAA